MNIKVAAFTVSEKSSNIISFLNDRTFQSWLQQERELLQILVEMYNLNCNLSPIIMIPRPFLARSELYILFLRSRFAKVVHITAS